MPNENESLDQLLYQIRLMKEKQAASTPVEAEAPVAVPPSEMPQIAERPQECEKEAPKAEEATIEIPKLEIPNAPSMETAAPLVPENRKPLIFEEPPFREIEMDRDLSEKFASFDLAETEFETPKRPWSDVLSEEDGATEEDKPNKLSFFGKLLAALIVMLVLAGILFVAFSLNSKTRSNSILAFLSLSTQTSVSEISKAESQNYLIEASDMIETPEPPSDFFDEPVSHEETATSTGEVSSASEHSESPVSSKQESAVLPTSSTPISKETSKSVSKPVSSEAPSASKKEESSESSVVSKEPSSVAPSEPISEPVISEVLSKSAASSSETSSVTTETFLVTYKGTKQSMAADQAVNIWLSSEVGNGFPLEATKAQAVAAYTYLKRYTKSKSYVNIGSASPQGSTTVIGKAIASVSGKAMYVGNDLAFTPWFSMSIGVTLNSENVWSGSVSNLKSVDSSIEIGTTVLSWCPYAKSTAISESDMKSKLESYYGITLSGSPEKWLVVDSYYKTVTYNGKTIGYVNKCTVDGSLSTTGRVVREGVFAYGLRSSAFDLTYNAANKEFTITTYGYGHGCGMSQVGALLYAKEGWNYEKILKHYYTGITIK